MLEEDLDQGIKNLMRLTVESGAPNCNRLNETLRTLPHLLLNTKTLAYELSRLKSVIDQAQHGHPELGHYGLTTKLCTAADLESSWAAYWIRQLCIPAVYHRKNWELCFVMQALYESLTGFEGKHGLGFACGIEKIPSCLASLNAIITATDAPPGVAGVECWSKTRQHSSGRDQLFHPDLISKEAFASRVCFDFVDMNEIPDQYQGRFDFCWSTCAAEHLGSIEGGMRFMENSLGVLKPGGVAVHTLEFNLDEGETIDHWPTVLFQRRHIEELSQRVSNAGGTLYTPDYDEGSSYHDRYVDTPPYNAIANQIHLKLDIDGFRCTCIGLILRKN